MTRYWVEVADSLLEGTDDWVMPEGLRLVTVSPRTMLDVTHTSWCLFEDDNAPPELDGKKVQLVIRSRTEGGRHRSEILERKLL